MEGLTDDMEALTREQAAVVADRNADILVSAGAGSGKTRVLVERYVALLADCRIPQIAAVTFTDAAAAEMRERVRREVRDRPELADHLAELDQAVIGTIHALCLQILREHPVAAGAVAAARVLPDDEAEHERIGAALDALEDAAQADDGRALAIRELGVFSLSEQLPQMIERRDEVAAAFGRLGAGTVEDWERRVRPLLETALRTALEPELPELERLVAGLRRAHAGAAPTDRLAQQVADLLAAFGDPLPDDPGAFVDAVVAACPIIKLNVGSKKSWDDLAAVKADLRALREAGGRLQEVPRWQPFEAEALQVTAALKDVFEDACDRYRARKAELSGCDYLDLELEAIHLLEQHPEIAADYRGRLRHVMVDEAQDLNETQVRLLRLLTGARAASPAPGGGPHRFLVGDAKQSIYRFRGSDVAHFNRYQEQIGCAGGSVRALTQSFRTHDELVEVCNGLFDLVFADGAGPGAVRMQRLSGRGPATWRGPHLAGIPIARTPGADDVDRRRVEADAVGREIAALLEAGAPVWAAEAESVRAASPRDVAILLRRLANVHVFEQALESHGVPYVTPAGAGFFTRQEVRDLTNLLAWLAEPDDHIALVGALRSPLFMLDDRTLLACHAADQSWLRVLVDPPGDITGDARQRCKHAAAVLRELREAVALEPPDAIAERALDLTGFEAAWAPVRGGEQALANIRKLVAILRTLGGRSIDEAVAYLHRRRDELADREGLAVVDRSDAVRLLTIHGAKGLEFPIVFVPEAHIRPPEAFGVVRWRPADGIAVTLSPDGGADERRRRPGLFQLLRQLDRSEEDAEYRRLLYVAATRAADRLYVSGDEDAREGSWMALCRDTLAGTDQGLAEIRPPVPVDLDAIARSGPPAEVAVPPASAERTVTAPLVERPAVIPLRSSTPVTSLRVPAVGVRIGSHGDGMGLLRGNLAHEAIRLWFTTGVRPSLQVLLARLRPAAGGPAEQHALAEVDEMLDRFDGSELAQVLRQPGTRAHFELPFGWYWDGAPVHGTIDLAYEHAGRWHLVDFKTDEVRRGRLKQAAAPYLGQVALYAGALGQALGSAPVASLYFLRPGAAYLPTADELRRALQATRSRIDAGGFLAEPEP